MPATLDVHLICDDYATHKTPAIKKWLLAHPRFHLHFTPTGSSWLNLVERWFAELTNKQIRRGVHRSVQALEKDIRNWITAWNTDPKPYLWTKTADEILERLAICLNRIPDSEHENAEQRATVVGVVQSARPRTRARGRIPPGWWTSAESASLSLPRRPPCVPGGSG